MSTTMLRLLIACTLSVTLLFCATAVSQTITVTAPPAGISVVPGDTVHVRWTSTGATMVDVSLTTNNGIEWMTVTTKTIPAALGDYAWVVPQDAPSSATCMLRVSEYAIPNIYGTSGVFSIKGQQQPVSPVISLLQKELTFTKDSVCVMNATNSGGGSLPDLSTASSLESWLTAVVNNTPVNSATITTTVNTAGLADGTYRDTVTLSGATVAPVSYVVIVYKGAPPTAITVTLPAGGEQFNAGDSINVRWDAPLNVTSVSAGISADDGLMWTDLGNGSINRANPRWGNMRLRIPTTMRGLPSSQCRVRISSYVDMSIYGISKMFRVDGVSSGGVPKRVQIYPSRVLCLPGDTVRFNASVFDEFGDVINVPVSWRVGNGAGDIAANGLFVAGDSLADFAVIATVGTSGLSATGMISVRTGVSASTPVRVISPNRGELWQVGQQVVIEWGVDVTKFYCAVLQISANDGITWHMFTQRPISVSDTSWGRFVWTVPREIDGESMISTKCRIRCSDYASQDIDDISDSVFTITEPQATLVDRSGGTVNLGTAVAVQIPADARKSEDAGDTLRIIQTRTSVDPPCGFQLANSGDVFLFLPHGTSFDAPVEISIPYTGTGTDVKILHRPDDSTGVWDTLTPTRIDTVNDKVYFSTTHFSVYAVAMPYVIEQAVPVRVAARPARVAGAIDIPVRRVNGGLVADLPQGTLCHVTVARLDGRVITSAQVRGRAGYRIAARVRGACVVRVRVGGVVKAVAVVGGE